MKHHPLHPVGARITDVVLDALTADEVHALRCLLAEHGVLIFAGQSLDDAAFVAFLRSFGELAFTKGESHVEDHPDLNVVSNVGRTTPPTSSFHVDTSYVREPPAYTALRAVRIPDRGGATQFTNQYRAYATLPGDVRERLAGRTITHVVTGLALGPDDETSADHPVFRPHPLTNTVALYVSTAARCAAISGLSPAEAEATIAFLIAHSTRDDNILRHEWSAGDIVMWDNGAVLHRADHSEVVGDRVMHRGMVAAAPGGEASPERSR